MKGNVVKGPQGEDITLVDVGTEKLLEDGRIRIWDVELAPGAHHPWHEHHNPYVVLSVSGSTGRMDWLDGRESRNISEYTGGAVLRPISPIHCLTNTGSTRYRNHLIELLDIGEKRTQGPLMVGDLRSVENEPTPDLPRPQDEWVPVIGGPEVSVWLIELNPGASTQADLPVPAVTVELNAELHGDELRNSLESLPAGIVSISNESDSTKRWFVVSLNYLADDYVPSPEILEKENS